MGFKFRIQRYQFQKSFESFKIKLSNFQILSYEKWIIIGFSYEILIFYLFDLKIIKLVNYSFFSSLTVITLTNEALKDIIFFVILQINSFLIGFC